MQKGKNPIYLSPVRRIGQVATEEKLCAMTFSGGPCRLPASPDRFRGKPLTLVLAEILERYGAYGTFAVVGDTSGGYPDRAGKQGSPAWNGVKHDHCPDYGKDEQGGVAHCPELVTRLLAGGHEIAGHTYTNTLFGWRPQLFGGRKHHSCLESAVRDLRLLHAAMEKGWGRAIRLGSPPHAVDAISGGFTSYDAFALMGYQYLSSSFDGAGQLPLASYEAEVEAAWKPMERLLLEDSGAFRGQIIALKDGFNRARRSPVADGLERQLQLLTDHGYRVVTVSELMERSPFADALPDSSVGRAARRLLGLGWCVAYQDNALRPDEPLARGELAMMAYGRETIRRRIRLIRAGRAPFRDMAPRHPYAAAAAAAVEAGVMTAVDGRFRPDEPVSGPELNQFCAARLGRVPAAGDRGGLTHGQFFLLVNALLDGGHMK